MATKKVKTLTSVTVRYRLYRSIYYESIEIDTPLGIDENDLQSHCYNVLHLKFKRQVGDTFFIISKKYKLTVA